ncbi:MAG TPA: wax ester/triacylglycerol synthase family O-acyltransferase [Acidimicrobiia bacterium]|nr:wax ester/triacylglycerol synthase family O-acyltransferase [Acidimicrobiia bacterium]
MEQLQGLDSLFIHHETPHAPLHVLAVMNVNRARASHAVSADTYRKLIAARIQDFPGLCKKLVDPPLPIAPPLWVRARPDLRIHVREVTLGENSIPADFSQYLATIDASALDRSRPLWEFHIIHETTSDVSHLVAKAHHALLDGIAGFELMANIFDADATGADKDLATPQQELAIENEIPDWTTHIGATLITQPVTWAQSSIKVARNVVNFAKNSLDQDNKGVVVYPWNAPAWPERRVLTTRRAVSEVSLDKATIKSLRRTHSVSFHDVLGAIVAGALRDVLIRQAQLPASPLVCVSPVSVRRKRAMHGNELAVIFAQLPTHLDDPAERVMFMKNSFGQAKEFLDSLGADTLGEISRLAPWAALGTLWGLYSGAGLSDKHSPFANLMLSSLPGPSFPLYCAGTKVESAYPYGPIFDGSLLNVTAISYLDKVNCGIVSCPDTFDGVNELARAMETSCSQLATTIQ